MRHLFHKKKETTKQDNARAAVMDLVFADSEEDIREAIARSGSILSSERAHQVFDQLLDEAHGDRHVEARLRDRLARIRTAKAQSTGAPPIPRERIIEILQSAKSERRFDAFIRKHPEAQAFWDELIEERATASKHISHMKRFLMLETYPEQKLYLKQHPEVLSCSALAWLEMQVMQPGLDNTRLVFYGLYAALLDDIRHSDIDTAFQRYSDRRSPWDAFDRRRLLTSADTLRTSKTHSTPQPGQPRVFLISEENDRWAERIVSKLKQDCLFVPKLAQSDTVVVIVGPQFGRKHSAPENGVFLKLRQALAAGKTILPILVGGSQMPDNLSLPSDVRKLLSLQAVVVNSESTLQSAVTQVLRGALSTKSSDTEDAAREAVFISYRRADSQEWARRLARALRFRMGTDLVFLDVARTRAGQDFTAQIEKAISGCSDFIVVIGQRFFETDAKGIRRIDQPNDYVRKEITAALSREKRVHMVLVDNAKMPEAKDLPDKIAQLAGMKSIFRAHSDADLQGIVDHILAGRFPDKYDLGHGLETPDRGRKSRAVAASIVSELTELGWRVVDKRGRYGWEDYTLYKSEFPRSRLCVTQSMVLLQEQKRSVLLLGLHQWFTRRVWRSDPDMLRLTDDMLEAALNPERYIRDRCNSAF